LATFDQSEYQIRFEWGERGVAELAPISDFVIIVDVLSFSTCVDVAASRGATVFPYGWKDQRAEAYAAEHEAILAGRRGQGTYSLSPPSLAHLPEAARIVLPSPNGSTLTVAASKHATVLAGCLRNRSAIADFINQQAGPVTVIACGERWMPEDSLRPALEDQLGAGAILQMLDGVKSPEAQSTEWGFAANEPTLAETLKKCSSGKELIEKGFPQDVDFAAELDASGAVPVLSDRAYVNKGESR
jgi:2-phosphosulfolactate phosphatase